MLSAVGRARWNLVTCTALAVSSAFVLMLWYSLVHSGRPSTLPKTTTIAPMHAALQSVFDDGLAAAGAEDYGSQQQGPLRPAEPDDASATAD